MTWAVCQATGSVITPGSAAAVLLVVQILSGAEQGISLTGSLPSSTPAAAPQGRGLCWQQQQQHCTDAVPVLNAATVLHIAVWTLGLKQQGRRPEIQLAGVLPQH